MFTNASNYITKNITSFYFPAYHLQLRRVFSFLSIVSETTPPCPCLRNQTPTPQIYLRNHIPLTSKPFLTYLDADIHLSALFNLLTLLKKKTSTHNVGTVMCPHSQWKVLKKSNWTRRPCEHHSITWTPQYDTNICWQSQSMPKYRHQCH